MYKNEKKCPHGAQRIEVKLIVIFCLLSSMGQIIWKIYRWKKEEKNSRKCWNVDLFTDWGGQAGKADLKGAEQMLQY